MAEKPSVSKVSADWLVRGVLTRLGDSLDKFTGRRWTSSSSIATSELIERIKKLLDAEAKDVPGKGTVVPHNIKLRMQWDKFSVDSEAALEALTNELLVAAVDHINDSLYYTFAPVTMDVKPDYFIEGVKLMVSFEQFTEEDRDVEMNVTMPTLNVASFMGSEPETPRTPVGARFIARFRLNGVDTEAVLEFSGGRSLAVGRTGGNDLILDHTSVSKTHGSLAISPEGGLSVADTGSTNGTFVNDERIAYGKAISLAEGDSVRFGTVTVTFEQVAIPAPTEAIAESAEVEASGETVEIGGFEFRGREGPPVVDDQSKPIEDEPTTVATKVSDTGNASDANITVLREGPSSEPAVRETDVEVKE